MKLKEIRNIGVRLAELHNQGHKVTMFRKVTHLSVFEAIDIITVMVDDEIFGEFKGIRNQMAITEFCNITGIKRPA